MINIDKQDKIVRSCRSCVKLWGKHTERYGNHFCSREMIIYFPQTVKGMRRQCQLWAILDNYADITANYGVRMNLEKELEIKLIGCFILVAIIPFLFGWWFNPMTDTEGWYHLPGYLCIFCVFLSLVKPPFALANKKMLKHKPAHIPGHQDIGQTNGYPKYLPSYLANAYPLAIKHGQRKIPYEWIS